MRPIINGLIQLKLGKISPIRGEEYLRTVSAMEKGKETPQRRKAIHGARSIFPGLLRWPHFSRKFLRPEGATIGSKNGPGIL